MYAHRGVLVHRLLAEATRTRSGARPKLHDRGRFYVYRAIGSSTRFAEEQPLAISREVRRAARRLSTESSLPLRLAHDRLWSQEMDDR